MRTAHLLEACMRRALATRDDSRLSFEIDEHPVGSVSQADAELLAHQVPGVALDSDALSITASCASDPQPVLDALAKSLFSAGRTGPWRNEALPVLGDDGSMFGVIERAAVRRLGMRTQAVHLLAERADRRIWLQRRALTKDVDPGMLDTLAGGLLGARMQAGRWQAESWADAIRRESLEEAGLDPGTHMRRLDMRPLRFERVLPDGQLVEDLIIYAIRLANAWQPENRDGEVAGFECLSLDAVLDRIDTGELTLEASLAVLHWSAHRDAT